MIRGSSEVCCCPFNDKYAFGQMEGIRQYIADELLAPQAVRMLLAEMKKAGKHPKLTDRMKKDIMDALAGYLKDRIADTENEKKEGFLILMSSSGV